MLERLDGPENVLAFRAIGKIEKSDYDTVLEPAVDAMMKERGELRFVYVMDDAFDGYTMGAGWEDTKMGLGHLTKWKRCAVATSHDWIRHAVGMFRWMMPGEIKVFGENEIDLALAWAAGL